MTCKHDEWRDDPECGWVCKECGKFKCAVEFESQLTEARRRITALKTYASTWKWFAKTMRQNWLQNRADFVEAHGRIEELENINRQLSRKLGRNV